MSIGLIADEGSIFIEKEVTEGNYVAETESASAVEVLSDGIEFSPSKSLIERNNRTSTVETVPSRVGQKSMAGTIPTEFKAGTNEGVEPETSALYEALLGGKVVLNEVTSEIGHTTSKIYCAVGDLAQYTKGMIVKVKESEFAGVDHISPIKNVGVDHIELLVPMLVAPSDNVKIGASVQYYHKSGQPTLSVTNYLGGKLREKAIGMRCTSGELADFSTGALPKFTFGLEGLNYAREVGQPLFAPAYDSQEGVEPPIVLCSKIYRNDQEITVNAVTVSIANTLGFLTSTASCSGKISSRITKMNCNFTINPYTEDDNITNFDLFDNNEAFSIFGSSHNEGLTADEKNQCIGYFMPNCRIPEIKTGDEDGILTDAISGSAHKLNGNDTIFIAFL